MREIRGERLQRRDKLLLTPGAGAGARGENRKGARRQDGADTGRRRRSEGLQVHGARGDQGVWWAGCYYWECGMYT